jgi:hypothetical protein
MNCRHLLKLALYGHRYGIGAGRLAAIVTSPGQKITRKNVQRLLQRYAEKWRLS